MDHVQAVRCLETPDSDARVLSDAQLQQFIRDGFLKIEAAFPRDLADQGRSILWRDTGCDEDDPTTWTKAVIRLGMYGQEPFVRAANTAVLHKAFDQLVGPGRWLPRTNLGTFPIRFPVPDDPGDAGWHIDASFPPEIVDSSDFLNWRVNVTCAIRFWYMQVSRIAAPARAFSPSHRFYRRNLSTRPHGRRVLARRASHQDRIAGRLSPA